MTHEQKNSISTCYSRNCEQDVDPDLNLGLSFETTAISISLDLKSAESTLDRQVMAVWRGGGGGGGVTEKRMQRRKDEN